MKNKCSFFSQSVPLPAEGRVEHQKGNQTATSQWPIVFVFGVQLDHSCWLKNDTPDTIKSVDRLVLFSCS